MNTPAGALIGNLVERLVDLQRRAHDIGRHIHDPTGAYPDALKALACTVGQFRSAKQAVERMQTIKAEVEAECCRCDHVAGAAFGEVIDG